MSDPDPILGLIERATVAAIGIVVSCGPRMLDGQISSGDSFTKDLVKVSLFLQEKDQLGYLRWLVKLEGPDWSSNVVVRNSITQSDDITDWSDKYTWPKVENSDEDVTIEGRRQSAEKWLTDHSSGIGLDWNIEKQEREKQKALTIVKYIGIGIIVVFVIYLLA